MHATRTMSTATTTTANRMMTTTTFEEEPLLPFSSLEPRRIWRGVLIQDWLCSSGSARLPQHILSGWVRGKNLQLKRARFLAGEGFRITITTKLPSTSRQESLPSCGELRRQCLSPRMRLLPQTAVRDLTFLGFPETLNRFHDRFLRST